jgi:hypothetical protein
LQQQHHYRRPLRGGERLLLSLLLLVLRLLLLPLLELLPLLLDELLRLLLGLLLRLLPRPARGGGDAARRASPCTSTNMEQNGQLSILNMLLLASRAITISVQHQLVDTTTTRTCNVLEPHRVQHNKHLWWLPLCALQNKHHIDGKIVGIDSTVRNQSTVIQPAIALNQPRWRDRHNHGCFKGVDSVCA